MKTIQALVLSCAMAVGGCNSQQAQQAATIVDEVQQAAILACAFVPTATTILQILNASAGMTASAIATAVCQAVQASAPKSLSSGGHIRKFNVVINGQNVDVSGNFVRR